MASTPTAVPTAISQIPDIASAPAAPAPLLIFSPTAIPEAEKLLPSQSEGGLSLTVIVILVIVGIAVAAGIGGVVLGANVRRRAS